MSAPRGHLILLPSSLGSAPWQRFLPIEAHAAGCALRHFVVENAKAARAQLKIMEHPGPLAQLSITPLPDTDDPAALDRLLLPTETGQDVGLMSDAGCPGVADPGSVLVARAHSRGIAVRPLVGPSSLLLALMASGLNGQSFAFNGYLPVAEAERDSHIRRLEEESHHLGRTQIFIETPYRNDRMFAALLKHLRPDTRLCVARDLTTDEELIMTRCVADWRRCPAPELARRPALFLILAAAR